MPMFEYVRVIAYHSCQSCTPRNVITIIYIYQDWYSPDAGGTPIVGDNLYLWWFDQS